MATVTKNRLVAKHRERSFCVPSYDFDGEYDNYLQSF